MIDFVGTFVGANKCTNGMEAKNKKNNEKSANISIEENNIKLSALNITMFARLEKRRKNKNGEHPIKIRIIHNRDYRDYGTKQNATIQDYEKIIGDKPKGRFADKKIIIIALLNRAFGIVQELTPFNYNEFNEVYLNKQSNNKHNIYNWYDDKIKELRENGQISTALTYEYSKKSLQYFTKTEILRFDNITPQFLKKFEKQITNPTTVGIHLRPLRHIFNRAMDHPSNFITEYPFRKYKIPSPRNIKKALTKDEVKSIYLYEAMEGSPEAYYKDIWLFSYFANGINMKDICKLKYSNIKGGTIEFRRAKTMNTNKNTKPIVIVLTDDLIRIIDEFGTMPKAKENYIFDFLQSDINEVQEMAAIKQATKQTNKYIKRIATNLNIEAEVSTYTARHSFATILKNAGVSPSFIGESMGHTSTKTTESYFGSFETDQRKDNIDKLKDW